MNIEETLAMFNREIIARRGTMVLAFMLIALAILASGWVYKAKYESTVTILADSSNIIKPLLEGTAEATEVTDRAEIAREVIFSRDIVDHVIRSNNLAQGITDPASVERVRLELYKNTVVADLPGNNFLIAYKNTDPLLAYNVTKQFGDLFLERSIKEQSRESNEAFDFIQNQVQVYREKLAGSEERLRDFRSRSGLGIVSNSQNIDQEIIELRRSIEKTELDLREAQAQEASLKNQLSGESASVVNVYRANKFQEQIGQLLNEIERLRLDYTDTYPDIVRLKQQIADLREMEERERSRPNGSLSQLARERASASPVYQQLKGQLAKATIAVETLRVRLNQKRSMLRKETDRASSNNNFGAQLADLKRDYQVNQEIYQDMLRRREQARVSMNLDEQQQGLSFRIQEPAVVPTIPKGLRFLHFLAGGLVLAVLLPLGLLFAYLNVDPKLRLPSTMQDSLGLPVLAVVPHYKGAHESSGMYRGKFVLTLAVLAVVAIYGIAGWVRITGGTA
ncbi:MAG: XrtA system polysaccharide chain length determinant [Granulosicoccaceae bacterium]